MEEERENIRDAGIFPSQLKASWEESRIQAEEECSADLDQNQREVGDKDLDQTQDSGVREWAESGLPPSDSFADFCSAPSDQEECLGGEAGGDWVAFGVMGAFGFMDDRQIHRKRASLTGMCLCTPVCAP